MLEEQTYGPSTLLLGPDRGRYPDGNSLLVRGHEETVLIDPSLGVRPRREQLDPVDWCLASHCHEDHVAGLDLFADRPFRLHEADAPGTAVPLVIVIVYPLFTDGSALRSLPIKPSPPPTAGGIARFANVGAKPLAHVATYIA